MSDNDIARVYAASLVEFGQEKNLLIDFEEEIKFISELVTEDKSLHLFLSSPGIPRESKKDLVNKALRGKISDFMVNFLNVLIDNDRQSLLADICAAVVEKIDRVSGRERITITVADSIDEAMKNRIAATLKSTLKKDVIITEKINKSILGGIIIRIGDMVIDGSLAKDLKRIKNNLLNSKVRSEAAYED